MQHRLVHLAAASMLAIAAGAHATSVYGSLGNFDAVNDTGHEAHGFEIEIEDSSFDHSKITSVFGLDRDFGVPAASVERYGAPVITDVAGFGVRITYKGSFNGTTWDVGTSSGTYPNPGDSCWSLGNASYPNVSCDHFGVGTIGDHLKVNYNWLVDTNNDGVLEKNGISLPTVSFVPPAVPANPVQVVVNAPEPQPGKEYGEALWVKFYSSNSPDPVFLDQLVNEDAVVPDDAEVEIEWAILQNGPGNEFAQEFALGAGDEAVVRKYEFFKYLGAYDPENGEAICDGDTVPGHACDNPFGDGSVPGINDLGAFVGDQIVAYNAVAQPGFPGGGGGGGGAGGVPEPAAWELLLAGFGVIGVGLRRREVAA